MAKQKQPDAPKADDAPEKQPDAPKAAASGGYVAQTPIEHDGVRYEIGEQVPLDAAAAAPLLKCGAVIANAPSDE